MKNPGSGLSRPPCSIASLALTMLVLLAPTSTSFPALAEGSDAQAGGEQDAVLIKAVMAKDLDGAKASLAQGASPDAMNEHGASALSLAVFRKDLPMIRLLLEKGADPNAKHPQIGDTAIFNAGNPELAQMLLDAGADLTIVSKTGTALQRAALNGESEMVLWFLDHGAATSPEHLSEALAAAGSGCISLEALKALLTAGADASATQDAMKGAVLGPRSCLPMVKALIESGYDINHQDGVGNSALMLAAVWGHEPVVKYLLESGADPTLEDDRGDAAIDMAKTREIKKLLKAALKRKGK